MAGCDSKSMALEGDYEVDTRGQGMALREGRVKWHHGLASLRRWTSSSTGDLV